MCSGLYLLCSKRVFQKLFFLLITTLLLRTIYHSYSRIRIQHEKQKKGGNLFDISNVRLNVDTLEPKQSVYDIKHNRSLLTTTSNPSHTNKFTLFRNKERQISRRSKTSSKVLYFTKASNYNGQHVTTTVPLPNVEQKSTRNIIQMTTQNASIANVYERNTIMDTQTVTQTYKEKTTSHSVQMSIRNTTQPSERNTTTGTLRDVMKPLTFLCPFEGGRMGNMLFNFAATYCIAKKVNKKLIIPQKYKLLKYFNIDTEPWAEVPYLRICSTTKNKNLRRVRVKGASKYTNITMPEDNDVILYGYLQSWRYFDDCKDDIRAQLTFKDKKMYNNADDRLKQSILQLTHLNSSRENFTIVGIQVRRGDFIKYGAPVATKSYFKKARDFYRSSVPNVVFIIVTDWSNESRTWCQENIVSGNNDTVLLDKDDLLNDMATMWACDHVIITIGTFSWWSAWLNRKNGKIVYYLADRWRNKNQDYVLPNWIGISD